MSRVDHFATLETLLAGAEGNAPVETLLALGRVARVAHGDDLDLAARADTLLGRITLPNLGELLPRPLAAFADTLAFGDDAAVLFADLERVGALLAGARVVSFDHPSLRALADRAEAASRLGDGEAPTSRRRVTLALLANAHIAEHGAVPGPDDAVIAVSDALVPALHAAFRGERIDTLLGPEPRSERARPLVTERARPLAASELTRLGLILQTALDRQKPLAIAPDLLELTPFFLASSAPELVLHDDGNEEPILAAEPFPGVLLRVHLDVLEIELGAAVPAGGAYPEPVLLPLVGDAALSPCRCRAGQTARHFVFEPSDHPAVDAYALLLGDDVAVLRA